MTIRTRRPAMDRLWAKVDRSAGPDACWPFVGSRSTHGYGRIQTNTGDRWMPAAASRLVLEEALGRPLGPGMETLHSCDNPPCCNPAHLSEGTRSENVRDMHAKGRWHPPVLREISPTCKRGHDRATHMRPLGPAGRLKSPRGRGKCRQCETDRQRMRRLRAAA